MYPNSFLILVAAAATAATVTSSERDGTAKVALPPIIQNRQPTITITAP